ncbi:MAG: LacI family DNA-binding transcriptional regulator [Victivallaceae bacterium]|nr:LacI family DNA-binding transcriptional regulator [Victivallaceae bacterium]
MVTINDVAQASRVSKSTVSLVINDSRSVSGETRRRVLAAIETLGYKPNPNARKLKGAKSRTVGIVVTHLENPFSAELLAGVERVLEHAGYTLFAGNSRDEIAKERMYLERMAVSGVDGVIVIPASEDGEYYNAFAREHNIPLVMASRAPSGLRLPAVLPDNFQGAYRIGRKMIGFKRPCVALEAEKPNDTSTLRLAGIRQALAEAEYGPLTTVRVPDFTTQAGFAAGEKILASMTEPLTIFAINDMLALGVVKALSLHKKSIPRDAAVFGFDGLEALRNGIFDITSMHIPVAELGSRAARLLLEKISEPASAWFGGEKITIPVELLLGHSA